MQSEQKDTMGCKGKYTITKAKLVSAYHFKLAKRISEMIKKGEGNARELIDLLHSVTKTEVIEVYNLVPTVGRTMIANNLTDASPDNSPLISHIALGDDATAPTNGDTILGNEVYRNVVASRTNGANTAYATGFFDATEVVDHFYEAGVFCDGTGTADTGILLSHVNIDIDKDNTETLTIDWQFIIT